MRIVTTHKTELIEADGTTSLVIETSKLTTSRDNPPFPRFWGAQVSAAIDTSKDEHVQVVMGALLGRVTK